jgi:hypothetical protein
MGSAMTDQERAKSDLQWLFEQQFGTRPPCDDYMGQNEHCDRCSWDEDSHEWKRRWESVTSAQVLRANP